MRAVSGLIACVLLVLSMPGCASRQTVTIAPRIDLKQHELIGVVEFDSSSEGELGPLATRRFTESARRDQGLVRVVSIGSSEEALRSVGRKEWDAETFRALGREHGVETIVIGNLSVSDIRPNIRIDRSLRSGSLTAQVGAELDVQMIETATGASIWNTSGRASQSVGHVSVFGGKDFVFDAEDPEGAYGGLIDTLVAQVTSDFHVRWERR
jgi:hypothetical protein